MKKISEMVSGFPKNKIWLCFLLGILLLMIAIPTKEREIKTGQTETISYNASLLEQQLEQVLVQIEGIGMVETMVTLEPLVDDRESPKVLGVLVVAQSGDDPVQILKIQEAVMTLFQVDAHKIKVMKMK